ncbi:unnamed protein product [Periconia digitata]|uniref:Fungal N-terminal domain-containing protein n=1 Tax=Periconia digitata TaxID=1303443 RepID=A0A9W4UX73_9PLEO|nr:unnamed protein product [Periconia digitata]
MADPISLIAGIVGIAAATAQLSNAVYTLSDKIMHAPLEIRNIASNMLLLSSILENLAQVLEEGKDVYKEHLLLEAESILERMKEVQKDVGKMLKRQKGVRARVKWVLSYKKVGELGARIEALKSALGLVLSTVQLAMWKRDPKKEEKKGVRLRNLVEAVMKQNRQAIISLKQQPPPPLPAPPHMNNGRMLPNLPNGEPAVNPFAQGMQPYAGAYPYENPFAPGMSNSLASQSHQLMHAASDSKTTAKKTETAAWLYQLSFKPEMDPKKPRLLGPPPPGEKDDGNVTDEMSLIPATQKLQKITIPSAIQGILGAWTVLDSDEIESIASEYISHPDDDLFADNETEKGGNESDFTDETEYSDTESFLQQAHPAMRRPMLKSSNSEPNTMGYAPYPPYGAYPGYIPPPVGYPPPIMSGPPSPSPTAVPPQPATSKPEVPPAPPPQWNSPPPPPPHPADNSILEKLEELLRSKEEQDRKSAENAKFSRLEELLIQQERARVEKDVAKRKAAEEAANAAAMAKKNGDEMKLDELEKLILGQKDEQLKREAMFEAALKAERADYDAKLQKQAADMKGSAEAAAKLLEAAKRAREETEARSAEELESSRHMYENQLKEEKELREELEDKYETRLLEEDRISKKKVTIGKMNEERLRDISVLLIGKLNRYKIQSRKRTFLTLDGKSSITVGEAHSPSQELELLEERYRFLAHDATSTASSKPANSKEEEKAGIRRSIRRCRRQLETLQIKLDQLSDAPENEEEREKLQSAILNCRHRINNLGNQEEYLSFTSPTPHSPSDPFNQIPPPPPPPFFPPAPPPPPPALIDYYIPSDDDDSLGINYNIMFNTYNTTDKQRLRMVSESLHKNNIESFFEKKVTTRGFLSAEVVNSGDEPEKLSGLNDQVMSGSLMWAPSLAHGRSELFESLCEVGWMPVYVRGSETGQTWFHGPVPIHARFLDTKYVPVLPHVTEPPQQLYCLVGSEWIAEDALQAMGVEHKLLPSGFWMLPPDIVYDEILTLISTSFTLKEAAIRKRARKALNSDSLKLVEGVVDPLGSGDDIPGFALVADIALH